MLDWRTAALVVLTAMSMGCGATEGGSGDASVTCIARDAGLNVAYSSLEASSGCPAQWADLSGDGGIPSACVGEGLLCVYPQGQAVCSNEGAAGPRWWLVGAGPGCGELPPTQCEPCSLAPGSVCEYANGPSGLNATVDFCCDGNLHEWDLVPDGGCPNGNACGAIRAADYDQACKTAADCARVTEGDLCVLACTDCSNAAINTKALAQYRADFARRLSVPRDCPCPPGPPAVCDAGICGIGP